MIATLDASPALTAYERELHHEAVRRLSDALIEACPEGNSAVTGAPPSAVLRTSASLTAALWLAAIRALLVEQRAELTEAVGAAEMSLAVEHLAEQVLGSAGGEPHDPAVLPGRRGHAGRSRGRGHAAGRPRRAGRSDPGGPSRRFQACAATGARAAPTMGSRTSSTTSSTWSSDIAPSPAVV